MDQPDFVKVTEIFLVPTSILIGAFSVAATEPLKTALSLVCLIVATFWMVCLMDAWPDVTNLTVRTLAGLPTLFFLGSFVSVVVHSLSWKRLRNKQPPRR